MELYEAMRTTPATREFTDEPVDDGTLYRMLDHARFAPSGGNRQGWRVIVLQDPVLRRRIRQLYQLGWREYAAQARRGLLPFGDPAAYGRSGRSIDLAAARHVPAPNDFADGLERVPVLLLVLADLNSLSVVDNDLARQSISGGGSVYPFCANLLLAARNEGLGAVMTSVLARQEPAVRRLLRIPDGFALAALIGIGRPRQVITRLRRAPVSDFSTVDRFGAEPFRAAAQVSIVPAAHKNCSQLRRYA